MDQAINFAFKTNEDTEVGDGFYAARNGVAFLVLLGKGIPWVLLTLLEGQRNTTSILIDIQNHDLYLVSNLHNLGRMDVLVGPIHLGYVHQAFHTLFDFSK